MKTAEEILKSKLDPKIVVVNNPDYTFNKVIEAMEEYAMLKGAGKSTFVNVYQDEKGRYIGDSDYQTWESAYNNRDVLSTYLETVEILRMK